MRNGGLTGKNCRARARGDQGKTRRMEGDEGMWPAGQLVVGSVLGSQFVRKRALEAC